MIAVMKASAFYKSAGTQSSRVRLSTKTLSGSVDDPNAKILGENTALAVIAHETGHRWLTQFQFSDGRGGCP